MFVVVKDFGIGVCGVGCMALGVSKHVCRFENGLPVF